MIWLTVRHAGEIWTGVGEGAQVCLVSPGPLDKYLRKAPLSGAVPEGRRVDAEMCDVLQPILRPGKILAIALNYAAHASESTSFAGAQAPGIQKWFNKQVTSAHPPFAPVHLPRVSSALDYEAELVVVIGQRCRHVPAARAWEVVAGLACGCDFSVRDWQKASPTMIMGKGFDTHAPFGPGITPLADPADLPELEIRGFVNGELRQSAAAGEMIHSIPEQIAHLTAAFTLEPGDIIFTGTPAGVGQAADPPRYLKVGDRVRVEIDGLGHIENAIVSEPLSGWEQGR